MMKLPSCRFLLSFAAAFAVGMSAFAGDNLVVNGDFEAYGFTGDGGKDYKENCGSTYLIGWTCNQAGICLPKGTYLSKAIQTYDNSVWAFLKNISHLSQDVSVAFPGKYRLEFDFCGRQNFINNAITVVTFGEATVTNIVGSGLSENGTKVDHVVCEFSVESAGTYTLKFAQTKSGDLSPAFDNVSLVLKTTGIKVASSPEDVGEPDPAFGLHEYATGTQVACASTTDVEGESVKYHLAGWTMDDGGVVTSGGPTGIVWTVGESVANLTWLWSAEYKLTVATSGTGTVEGEAGWYDDGEQVTLTAGDGFVVWQGDVDEAQALDRTITVTMDRARTLTAVFGDPVVDVGYSRLYDYLESDGTQVIDLGVKMQKKTLVEVYFQRSSSATTMQKFFGAYTATGGSGAAVGCSTAVSLSSTFNTSWRPNLAVGENHGVRMHVQDVYQANGGYQDSLPQPKNGGVVGDGDGRFVNKILAQDLNYYAFGVNVDGEVTGKGAVRIRRILIQSDDGKTLHDFRPAKKGGVYGLFDKVTGDFRTNCVEGANAFVPGPEVDTAGDALEIASDPSGLALDFAPALGLQTGLAVGEELAVAAPSLDKPRLKATCTGWTLYSWNAVTRGWIEDKARAGHSGTGASFTYVHTGVASKLVWHYTLSDPGADESVPTRYVFGGIGNDANDGSTWTKAFRRVQAAIDASATDGTVLVGPGVYIDPRGFILTNGVKVVSACGYGATIIDGDNFRQGANIAKGAELDGFTIRNCQTGMGVSGGGADVAGTIRRCFITSNKTGSNSRGGGLSLTGNALASQCIVCSNTTGVAWGGIGVNMVENSVIEHSLVFDNIKEGGGEGGGIRLTSNNPTVRNCTVYGNTASTGGGIYRGCGKVIDTIVWGNHVTGDSSAGAPNWYGTGGANVVNTFSEVAWGTTVGELTLSGNPYFKDAANGDFRLQSTSVCRDNASGEATVDKDVYGNERVQNGKMDIGAVENDPNELAVSITFEAVGSLDKSTVTFTANGSGFDAKDAQCFWTFDGRTPSADDHDATGATVDHVFGNGTHSVALLAVYGGQTFGDRKADFLKVSPSTIYVVERNANPVSPYDSWDKAATNVNDAVSVAADIGSTIWVSNGVHRISSQIVLNKQFALRSVNGPSVTTLDGCGKCRVLSQQIGNSVVAGFTVTGGNSSEDGAGLNISAGMTTNCVIIGNKSVNNAVGGGVFMSGGTVTGCVISNNEIGVAWTGVGVRQTGGILENCLVSGNHKTSGDDVGGGGISQYHGGIIRNCTVVGNRGDRSGGIDIVDDNGAIINTIVWGNVGTDIVGKCTRMTNVCSSVAMGVNTSKRDLTADPLFVKPEQDDYRLRAISPCRNSAWGLPTTSVDLDGKPRVIGRRMDLGCYECDLPVGMTVIIR